MPPPDAMDRNASDELLSRLHAVAGRVRVAHAIQAVAAGALAGAFVLVLLTAARVAESRSLTFSVVLAAVVAAAVMFRHRHQWTSAEAARRIERAHPASRNVVITAEELLRHPQRASRWIAARVVADAAAVVMPLPASQAVRFRNAAVASVAGVLAWTAIAIGLPQRAAAIVSRTIDRAAGVASHEGEPAITATVVAPAYLGGESRTIREPERIEAVAGSRVSLLVSGSGAWRVRLGARALPVVSAPDGVSADSLLTESTYIAVEEQSAKDAGRRLIPVIVTPDRVPSIRIEQPAKDLLLASATSDIPVAAAATDDFGLSSLELRFTRVSGSGEQFDFQEGTTPLEIDRRDPRSWKGRAALHLSRLKLQPGDSIVYRVVGADARTGDAGMASSETFFVEIAGPGQVTVAGFELPPDRERYALSQQMIVLKIQRLRARERTMARDAVEREMGDLAAEQRAVRANFVFLLGGQVEDEEEEAAHSHEIQEGRLENTARREMTTAIQFMSHAEKALVAIDSATALPAAKAAADALQRAFGRNRYILRTMPVRSRIDPARRLAGELSAAVDSTRASQETAEDPATRAARDLLSALLDLATILSSDPARVDGQRLSGMAENALAAGAGSKDWQQIAAVLLELRDAAARNRDRQVIDSLVNKAVSAVLAEVHKHAIVAAPGEDENRALLAAWSEQRRVR